MAKAAMKTTEITLTHVQIRNALPVLKGLRKQAMGPRLSLIVVRLGRELSGHASDSEEVRETLIRKYAEKDEKDEPIVVPILDEAEQPTGQKGFKVEDKDALNAEWKDVLLQEVEVEIPLLPLRDLDKSNIELTPEEMEVIEPLLME